MPRNTSEATPSIGSRKSRMPSVSKTTRKTMTCATTATSSVPYFVVTSPVGISAEDRAQVLAQSFCQNFSCCSMLLKSMHDLLDHYETYHVFMEDPSILGGGGEASAAEGTVSEDGNNGDLYPSLHQRSNSVNWRVFAAPKPPSPSTLLSENPNFAFKKRKYQANGPGDIYYERSNNNESAFDLAVVRNHESSFQTTHFPQHIKLQDNTEDVTTDDDEQQHNDIHSDPLGRIIADVPPLTIAPASLNSSDDDDCCDFNSYSEYALLKQMKALRKKERDVTATTGDSIVDKDKKYRCLVPGCEKLYRNQNGLKYHVDHCHSIAEKEMAERLLRAIREDPTEKPFSCHFAGCTKRYRNTNGLKYHLLHHHNDNRGSDEGNLN